MKKIIRILLLILILVLIISIVQSQKKEYKEEDYLDINNYKDIDFYKNSDPTLWDYTLVDWNKVDFNRKDIYTIQTFFDNLPNNKYRSLNYKLIDNYDLISDHRKIYGTKYLRDLGCDKCRLLLEYGIRHSNLNLLTFSSKGIKHTMGDSISIPGTYPEITWFEYTKEGIIAIFHKHIRSITIPEEDSLEFYQNYKYRERNIEIGNIKFKINGGGAIKIRDGKVFVKSGFSKSRWDKTFSINDVGIEAEKNDVRLFFDGKNHQECDCTYVSMNKNKKIIISQVQDINGHTLTINEPWIKIRAPLKLKHNFGTLTFQKREGEELIPSISMKFEPLDPVSSAARKERGELNFIEIRNGNSIIYVKEDGSVNEPLETSSELVRSNPLRINIIDINEKSLLGTDEKPKSLIIDNFGRVKDIDFDQLANFEQARLYFGLPEDVKVIGEKIKEASKIKEILKQEIKDKRGIDPMWFFGWFNDKRETRIIRGLIKASENSGFSPEFLTAFAFQEGINEFIEKKLYFNPDSELYADGVLGLLTFGDSVEELKRRGFVREDFNEGDEYVITRTGRSGGLKLSIPTFKNVDFALEGFAGVHKKTREDVINFIQDNSQRLDIENKPISEDQLNYWTYYLNNCGPGCMEYTILKNGIEIPKNPGAARKTRAGAGRNPTWNSLRFLATMDLIKEVGLFDNSISEKVSQDNK